MNSLSYATKVKIKRNKVKSRLSHNFLNWSEKDNVHSTKFIYFKFNFFRMGGILIIGGMVSPSKNPQGFDDSILSKISFTMASSGIARNIPGIPHKALPAITTITEKRAFIFTFEATIFGII